MKFFCILLAALCATTSFGQTIKTLGFNTTNGQVVANTGTNVLTFTNDVRFADGEFTIKHPAGELQYGGVTFFEPETKTWFSAFSFGDTTNAATTRTNLGLPLVALTNTSNVTMMRALAGSTNTNEPYNGIIQYADGPDGDTYEMTVSNGIILKIEMQ
jgi:hypothetical protein